MLTLAVWRPGLRSWLSSGGSISNASLYSRRRLPAQEPSRLFQKLLMIFALGEGLHHSLLASLRVGLPIRFVGLERARRRRRGVRG